MAKRPCCHKRKLRRGLWSPEEDEKLINHIAKYGHGCWSSVPKQAGLERCGKSCRLRWINYLRPDLKRGAFSQEEEDLIIHLHSMLGNKWSQIAAKLPGRTDNEVKNFWNSYIKKKLRERGIDPATHRPLAGGGAASTAMTRPVFSDAELIPAESAASLDAPVMPIGTSHVSLPSYQASSHLMSYQETSTLMSYFDMDALNCAAGGAPPPAVIPSVSSSSTLNSMAGPSPGATDEQCNNGDLPWLELGQGGADAAHVGHYGGALDELRWADYFEGAFQAAAASHGAQGQGIYEDSKDATQFNGHGLSSWC